MSFDLTTTTAPLALTSALELLFILNGGRHVLEGWKDDCCCQSYSITL